MTIETALRARSEEILRSWRTLDWTSAFSAVIYPALGVLTLLVALVLGFALESIHLHWWYAPLAILTTAAAVFVCNMGIGPLHRIWQHRAGHLSTPVQVIVAINCIIAMQGKLKDWVNYHSQHHRHADEPGDPHNPSEGKFWAWIGWILWRDKQDMDRPMARWLSRFKVVEWADRNHLWLSAVVHLVAPLMVYALFAMLGWPLVLAAILHASAVIGRAMQFHATTLGVNVFGHMKTPKWFAYMLALLTGGEALHGHHHDFPRSALNLPRKGIWNRIVDYNGTVLLILSKLRLARDLVIAPQFEPAAVPAEAR